MVCWQSLESPDLDLSPVNLQGLAASFSAAISEEKAINGMANGMEEEEEEEEEEEPSVNDIEETIPDIENDRRKMELLDKTRLECC